MYSFSYLEPVCCSISSSTCGFLTCIQISQEAGQVIWHSHLFQNFPIYCDPHCQRLWHTQYGRSRCFSIILLLFRWSSRSLDHLMVQMVHLISGSFAFSKTSLKFLKFMVHILLKPGLENFEHYFTGVWDECTCGVVSAFFGIALYMQYIIHYFIILTYY